MTWSVRALILMGDSVYVFITYIYTTLRCGYVPGQSLHGTTVSERVYMYILVCTPCENMFNSNSKRIFKFLYAIIYIENIVEFKGGCFGGSGLTRHSLRALVLHFCWVWRTRIQLVSQQVTGCQERLVFHMQKSWWGIVSLLISCIAS